MGIVWLVGAEWFEALFINNYIGMFFSDFLFFGKDFVIVYFGESSGEAFFVFWEENMILYFLVVYNEGAEPFCYEMHCV